MIQNKKSAVSSKMHFLFDWVVFLRRRSCLDDDGFYPSLITVDDNHFHEKQSPKPSR